MTQADQVDNPLFYGHAALTAGNYRAFLDRTTPAYVAVEHGAPLDSGGQAEAALVTRGLPYLTDVWSERYRTLYRVTDPRPLATVVRTTDTGVGAWPWNVDHDHGTSPQ